MGTLKPQSNGPLYSNTVICTLAVDRWAVTSGTAKRGGAPSPLLAVPNVTALLSTASTKLHIIPCGTIIRSTYAH